MSFESEETSPVIIYWDFNPYHPVRPDCAREVIFIEEWQKLMTAKAIDEVHDGRMREDRYFVENESWRYPVLDIFDFTPTAHQTRLASNFILYLGQNNGRGFLEDAQNLADKFSVASLNRAEAYLTQWALDNNPADRMAANTPARTWCLQRDQKTFLDPELTDIKILERMAYWCGTAKGQAFLQDCQTAVTQRFAARQSAKTRHIS